MLTPTIRFARADEFRELKRLRLEALADSPLAFGSTFEQEAAFADAVWQRRAADAAAGRTGTLALAAVGDEWVAMAAGLVAD